MANAAISRPVVAHVMRGYMSRTETFIGNQLSTLQTYRPLALTHHLISGHRYSIEGVAVATDRLAPAWHAVDRWAYRLARLAIPAVIDVLAQAARTQDARLLHYHYLVDARFFLALKRRLGLPAIVSAYGYDVSSFPQSYWGLGLRYLQPIFTQLDLFLAMSADMRRTLINLGCPPEKIVVHYHGIDTRRFAYPEREYLDKPLMTILICGTLQIKKAQHLVLEALRLVEQRQMARRDFQVHLVGDGPMRAQLERQIVAYGWQNMVTFFGHIPYHDGRLVQAYRNADIFTLPSISRAGDKEGIPGTIVEAMSSGLPVLSTYHAGIPEIIESGRQGLLVQEEDVEAMARSFADLINEVALRRELGRAAARRATTELDLQQRTPELEKLYTRILNG
jgi:colanic acid/amylovoran biosynthesis glycosyltransferase